MEADRENGSQRSASVADLDHHMAQLDETVKSVAQQHELTLEKLQQQITSLVRNLEAGRENSPQHSNPQNGQHQVSPCFKACAATNIPSDILNGTAQTDGNIPAASTDQTGYSSHHANIMVAAAPDAEVSPEAPSTDLVKQLGIPMAGRARRMSSGSCFSYASALGPRFAHMGSDSQKSSFAQRLEAMTPDPRRNSRISIVQDMQSRQSDDDDVPFPSTGSPGDQFTKTRSLQMKRYSLHEHEKKTTLARGMTVADSEHHIVDPAKWTAMIVQSKFFDASCVVLLLSNAIYIGMQVEHTASSPDGASMENYKLMDVMYAICFVVELLIRLTGLGCSTFFTGDDRSWNIFDLIVVVTGSSETILTTVVASSEISSVNEISNLSVVRIIRVARVVRILRVLRIVRFFRSLRTLVNAIANTLRSCLWTALLLCGILYIFGIMFAQAASDHLHEVDAGILALNSETEALRKYFGSLPRSMFTCFKSILAGIDWELAVQALSDIGEFSVAVFVLMVVFVYLAVMNVISGLFLQGAIEDAQADINEQIFRSGVEKSKYAAMFEQIFDDMDKYSDGKLTLLEFEQCLGQSSIQELFRALDLNVKDAWTLFKLLDVDNAGCVTQEKFIHGCWSLKGEAKGIHLAQMRYELAWLMDAILELANFVEESFTDMLQISPSSGEQNPEASHTSSEGSGFESTSKGLAGQDKLRTTASSPNAQRGSTGSCCEAARQYLPSQVDALDNAKQASTGSSHPHVAAIKRGSAVSSLPPHRALPPQRAIQPNESPQTFLH